MKKKRFLVAFLIIIIIINLGLLFNVNSGSNKVKISLSIQSDQVNNIQLFFSDNEDFEEINSMISPYTSINNLEIMEFLIPNTTNQLRIDLGETPANFMNFDVNVAIYKFIEKLTSKYSNSSMTEVSVNANIHSLTTNGNDPYLIYDISSLNLQSYSQQNEESIYHLKIILSSIIFLCIIFLLLLLKKGISLTIREIYNNWPLILDLAKNDFKTRYAGSYLGIIWAFVQPVVTILVYWFVFQVGFRSGEVKEVPFVLWLVAGLVPWFFFNESLNSATVSLMDYGYLVKKMVFNIRIIPLVKVLSALFVHIFFVAFILLLYILNDIFPRIYWIQIFYYSGYMIILSLGLAYITSSLMIFFRDLAQIINVVLQIGIWLTPIMWDYMVIPERYQWILKLNPMYYVVEGYRNSLIYGEWFWDNPLQTIYAWGIAIFLFVLGNLIFNKLKEYFADAL